ncbi:pilus assembly PilX family protein [[Acidovorax] ebreus]|uniref:Pilus assembly protein PilX n=1 Tax=Acidovorax ebreus (strain TPSY) TaxID=535289 RepID=A0A9J9UBW8_ACIET|nr:pilus assembly protein [[Acidovorax] ebreus]ACM33973.1 conserved hypothetical protein [[Acidovorax] ebreus TPSY]
MPQRMPPSSRHPRHPRGTHRQGGIALFVVLVFVMLSMLLALWASRTSLFNEMVVGNDADYQRATEAAQALLQDAELDIRGERADGGMCTGTAPVCRQGSVATMPVEAKDVANLLADLETVSTGPRCKNGLCLKRTGNQDFWNESDANTGLAAMQAVGTRYGTYTGAKVGDDDAPANPILRNTAAGQGGWYWIEVLPYTPDAANASLIAGGNANYLAVNVQPNVIYRVTAMAQGRKDSTRVVLQQTYVRHRLKD